MSVLVYTESWEGKFRKSTYEAVSYARKTAKLLDTDVIALAFGGESNIKASNFSTSSMLPSVSKATFALAFTLSASSENNFHSKLFVFEISFEALKGSIIEVRQAIGKPSKIKKPIR